MVTDLSSRHGTTVNERPLEPGVPVPIREGDRIAFGSWLCRVASDSPGAGATTSFAPALELGASVSAIPAGQLGGVAQRRLEVLMDLTGKLNTLADREAVASAAVESLQTATGCRRVVIVEPVSETELAVLASSGREAPNISRSLIEQAARQGLVELRLSESAANHAHSIVALGIRSAICAPVLVSGAPAAFITIDTRDAEGVVPKDAASFCQCVSQLVGLSFQRIADATMAQRHRELQSDLDAARRVQEMLSPPNRGSHGPVSHHFESIPGRVVAGDLFDVFALDSNRVAFFLGDVSGKGVGAAMLMAACQSLLRTQLLSGTELAHAMVSVNADLHRRSEASKFITIMCGVIDAQQQTVELVDAGHGFCVLARPGEAPVQIETKPGLPLGVVDATEYEVARLPIPPESSLVIFSDGAVEQQDHAGAQFGIENVLQCLALSNAREEHVEQVLTGVRDHASGPLADDLTVAAVWIG